MNGVLMKGDFG